jgi:hypothetical protein
LDQKGSAFETGRKVAETMRRVVKVVEEIIVDLRKMA